jgi:hypothetical protein
MLWLSLLVAVLLLWYLDRERLSRQIAMRNVSHSTHWSIDQILGRPDTTSFGDIQTAWASKTQDAQDEYVVVEFPQAVMAAAVEIYETYNPGAVVRVSAVKANGSEVVLWSGVDPLQAATGGGISRIAFSTPRRTRRLKIYIQSTAVSGWNEIDAVALVDGRGGRQWAMQAWASSSFGLNREPPVWYWP